MSTKRSQDQMVGEIVRRNLHTQPLPIVDQQCKLIPTTFQSKPYCYSIVGTSRKQKKNRLPLVMDWGNGFIVLHCFEAVVNNHFTRRPVLCVRCVNYAT